MKVHDLAPAPGSNRAKRRVILATDLVKRASSAGRRVP